MTVQIPHAVMCLWMWDKKNEGKDARHWTLVQAYPVDQDGYPPFKGCLKEDVFLGRTTPEGERRDTIHSGRCITVWDMVQGVSLRFFSPPTGIASWMAPEFQKELKKLKNWPKLIDGRMDLLFGTAQAARTVIENPEEVRVKSIKGMGGLDKTYIIHPGDEGFKQHGFIVWDKKPEHAWSCWGDLGCKEGKEYELVQGK